MRLTILKSFIFVAVASLVGCGGGDGGSNNSGTSTPVYSDKQNFEFNIKTNSIDTNWFCRAAVNIVPRSGSEIVFNGLSSVDTSKKFTIAPGEFTVRVLNNGCLCGSSSAFGCTTGSDPKPSVYFSAPYSFTGSSLLGNNELVYFGASLKEFTFSVDGYGKVKRIGERVLAE